MLRRAVPVLLVAALALGGCDTFFGKGEPPPLPGERVSVLRLNQELRVDPELSELPVRLPRPHENPEWPQAGGYSSHAMYHLALGASLGRIWTADIGEAAGSDRRVLAEPVVSGGRVFTLDAASTVTAFDLASGRELWQVDLTPEDEGDNLFGGGLAVAGDRLFVTSPFARVYALDAATGSRVWEVPTPSPIRAAPAYSDGRLFVLSIDNNLYVLAADDGRRLWSHTGLEEEAGLLGGSTPAVLGTVAVVPYTSGELYALQVETGRVLWNEQLGGGMRGEGIAALSDIRGRPVIDRDLVIAMNYSGTLAAIDLRTGARVWDANIGGTQSPWVGGDYVFVLSDDGQLFALRRDDGRIRWITPLPLFEDPDDREDRIYWNGPVLAGDRLLVTGSDGEALAISPYTGKILGREELDAPSQMPPIVAAGTLLLLITDSAELAAFR